MKQSPSSCALSIRRLVAASLTALLAVVPAHPQGNEPPRIGGTIAYVRALERPKVPVLGIDPPSGGPPCELRLFDVAQGVSNVVEQVSRGNPLAALSFSPSGEVLLVGEDLAQDVSKTSTMWKASVLWRIHRSGEVARLWEAPLGVLRWPAQWPELPWHPRYVWSPDGRRIATFGVFPDHAQGDRMRLYTVDVTSSKVTRRLSLPDSQHVVGWHPDGVHLLVPSTRDDWQPRGVVPDHTTSVPVYKYPPDGSDARLAFRCLGSCGMIVPVPVGISLWTLDGAGLVQTNLKTGDRYPVLGGVRPPGDMVGLPVISPSGDLAAYPVLTPTFLPWEREPGEGPRSAVALFGLTSDAGERIGLTREEPVRTCAAVPAHLPRVMLRWTPDSKYIVRCTASQWFPAPGDVEGGIEVPLEFADAVVDVIDVKTGKRWEIFRVKGHVLNIDWSPLKYDMKPKGGK